MTTETKPLDIPSVGEQIEINKKINERLKVLQSCQWTAVDDKHSEFDTGCGSRKGTTLFLSWNFCPWCGKKLVVVG